MLYKYVKKMIKVWYESHQGIKHTQCINFTSPAWNGYIVETWILVNIIINFSQTPKVKIIMLNCITIQGIPSRTKLTMKGGIQWINMTVNQNLSYHVGISVSTCFLTQCFRATPQCSFLMPSWYDSSALEKLYVCFNDFKQNL